MLENFTQLNSESQFLVETFGDIDMTDINKTLSDRGKRYGNFREHARITQNIKRAMIDSPNWPALSDDKKEALHMVAHKMGRILNGDPDFLDSWHDIVGYTKLVENELELKIKARRAKYAKKENEAEGREDADNGVFKLPYPCSHEPQDEKENFAYKKGFDARRIELGEEFSWYK